MKLFNLLLNSRVGHLTHSRFTEELVRGGYLPTRSLEGYVVHERGGSFVAVKPDKTRSEPESKYELTSWHTNVVRGTVDESLEGKLRTVNALQKRLDWTRAAGFATGLALTVPPPLQSVILGKLSTAMNFLYQLNLQNPDNQLILTGTFIGEFSVSILAWFNTVIAGTVGYLAFGKAYESHIDRTAGAAFNYQFGERAIESILPNGPALPPQLAQPEKS